MLIHTFFTPGLSIYSYFIGDLSSKRAVIVDPTRDVEPYIAFARHQGFLITDITETHVHADFVSGAKELKHRLGGEPVIRCSALGGVEWIPAYSEQDVMNREKIQLGSVSLEAWHMPGHTPEHLIWLCYDETRSMHIPCLALTGDLLFVGSVGRPDLLGEEETEELTWRLYISLLTTLPRLPDFLEIFPGHGAGSLCGKGLSPRASTTLGYERAFNPFLAVKSFDNWVKNLLKDVPAAPINFQRIKKINVKGAGLLSEIKPLARKPELIIDTRMPEIFAKSHIKDSINVPIGDAFCNWVSSVLDEEISLGIVGDSQEQISLAIYYLRLIGFDEITMQFVWDENPDKEFSLESLPLMDVVTLQRNIQDSAENLYILDVRTPLEWKAGHINEANQIELALLKSSIDSIPRDSRIAVICGSGYRASLAASLLKKMGYRDVANIQGGMSAWNKAKLPVVQNE